MTILMTIVGHGGHFGFKKMPMDEILHTLWKMFPGTLENWYQSTKKVCTTFPPEVRFIPDYWSLGAGVGLGLTRRRIILSLLSAILWFVKVTSSIFLSFFHVDNVATGRNPMKHSPDVMQTLPVYGMSHYLCTLPSVMQLLLFGSTWHNRCS